MAIEFDDFPTKSMVIFNSHEKLPGGTMIFQTFHDFFPLPSGKLT